MKFYVIILVALLLGCFSNKKEISVVISPHISDSACLARKNFIKLKIQNDNMEDSIIILSFLEGNIAQQFELKSSFTHSIKLPVLNNGDLVNFNIRLTEVKAVTLSYKVQFTDENDNPLSCIEFIERHGTKFLK